MKRLGLIPFGVLCLASCSGILRYTHAAAVAASYGAAHPTAGPFVSYQVPATSMLPTLKPGNVVLVDSGAYRHARPRRGDIVVFTPPVPSTDPFIKRVIAVPGDVLTTQGRHIFINGKILSEPYLREPMDYEVKIASYGLYATIPQTNDWARVRTSDPPAKTAWHSANRVPDDYYVLLGDNRNDSEDSHVFGLVSGKSIRGKMVAVL